MPELQLSDAAQQWVNAVLIWVGFGALAGLLAKSLIPGKEPSGTVGTILIGIGGSLLGPLVLCQVLNYQDFNPISPLGFLSAIGGALVLLIVYRVVIAPFFVERTEDAG